MHSKPNIQVAPNLEACKVHLPFISDANFVHPLLRRPFKTMQVFCSSSIFSSMFSNHRWFLLEPIFALMVAKWWFSNSSTPHIYQSAFGIPCDFDSVIRVTFLIELRKNWFPWCTNLNSASEPQNRMFYPYSWQPTKKDIIEKFS